jgi:DNA-binding MarR family transcriptional regulator
MSHFDDPAALTDLLERTARLIQSLLHAEGMPPAQLYALHYLARANRYSRTPTAIGLYLDSTKGTVSQTLNALVRKRLVCKEQNLPDRRSVSLRLTARGEVLLARKPPVNIFDAVAALSPKTRDEIGRNLAALLDAMIAMRGGRAFGQCASCRFFRRGGASEIRGGPHRCGLLEVPLSDSDAVKICVEHQRAA